MKHHPEKLLYPLDEFYARAALPLPEVEPLPGEAVPEPYRQLLVHDRDMTPTLEAFHGEPISLRVLQRLLNGASLARQVVLTLNGSARPVEFGAIVIHMDRFPSAARAQILDCRVPLGTLMRVHGVAHVSCPQAFFRLRSDALMNAALALPEAQMLYGRRNVHRTPEGQPLAEIVEILPPVREN